VRVRQAVSRFTALLLALLLCAPQPGVAYSVLSHEQVVDLAWEKHVVPALLARYPGLTPAQLTEAHGYVYGGAIIQDIGYYPFGNHLLSDMLHYVRSGDFVSNLLKEATSADEYAFALGALAHYDSDSFGHPAINRATAAEYPRLRDRYGPVVTYDDSPLEHLRTEFGFDVLEVSQRHYAPQDYHNFIGFQVSKPVFERAFRDTYGLDLDQVLKHEDLAIGSYRRTISTLFPKMTAVAMADYQKQLKQSDPHATPKQFRYRLSRAEYEQNWGTKYQRPSAGERVLAFFLRLLPKVGPLKDLQLKMPPPRVQKQFLAGMDTVVDHFEADLDLLRKETGPVPTLTLPNRNLDTGAPSAANTYPLADKTYVRYLALLTASPNKPVPQDVRANVLRYFGGGAPPDLKHRWRTRVRRELVLLKALPEAPPASAHPAASAARS
jgi:hypothetical protein